MLLRFQLLLILSGLRPADVARRADPFYATSKVVEGHESSPGQNHIIYVDQTNINNPRIDPTSRPNLTLARPEGWT